MKRYEVRRTPVGRRIVWGTRIASVVVVTALALVGVATDQVALLYATIPVALVIQVGINWWLLDRAARRSVE